MIPTVCIAYEEINIYKRQSSNTSPSENICGSGNRMRKCKYFAIFMAVTIYRIVATPVNSENKTKEQNNETDDAKAQGDMNLDLQRVKRQILQTATANTCRFRRCNQVGSGRSHFVFFLRL